MRSKAVSDLQEEKLYLSIDHLKSGTYVLHILLSDNIIKSVQIEKP